MTFWLGAAIGLFAGTFMGVLLTCILIASRRADDDSRWLTDHGLDDVLAREVVG